MHACKIEKEHINPLTCYYKYLFTILPPQDYHSFKGTGHLAFSFTILMPSTVSSTLKRHWLFLKIILKCIQLQKGREKAPLHLDSYLSCKNHKHNITINIS